jgi:hypothetical protein
VPEAGSDRRGWYTIFGWSEDPSTAWLVFSTVEDPLLLKTGFFRHIRELKIQRKNKSRQGFLALKVEEKGLSARG